MAAVSALIARAKRDGSIQATELTAELEKLDLPVEKIEHIYDTFDAMGIQIVSPELELDVSDDLGMDMDEVPDTDEEELVDPLELAAEHVGVPEDVPYTPKLLAATFMGSFDKDPADRFPALLDGKENTLVTERAIAAAVPEEFVTALVSRTLAAMPIL